MTVNRMRIRLALAVPAVLLAGGLLAVTGPAIAAHASDPQSVCGIGKTLCVHRNGGGTGDGTHIITYTAGSGNEYAVIQLINPCNSSYRVTSTCPFTEGYGYNSSNVGDAIVQIAMYTDSGSLVGCIGTNSSSGTAAELEPCNNAAGSGGGWGTIFVQGGNNTGPDSFPAGSLVNKLATDSDGATGSGVIGTLGNPDNCSLQNDNWLTINEDDPGCAAIYWTQNN